MLKLSEFLISAARQHTPNIVIRIESKKVYEMSGLKETSALAL